MVEINWQKITQDHYAYVHDKFVFKKKKVGDKDDYQIWEYERIVLDTYMEYQFLNKAKAIIEKRS